MERRTLEILGKTYRLAWRDDLPGAKGVCEDDELCIYLSRHYPRDIQIATVLHETIEALNDDLVLGLPHDTITRLDAALYGFLASQGVNLRPLVEERRRR